jgi:hypothetical protein
MSLKFDYYKFQNQCNPFGIIFNPVSIDKLVSRVVTNNYFKEEDLFFTMSNGTVWTTFWVIELGQSCFLTSINALIDVTKQHFAEASHVILTYGTAWIYRSNQSQEIVANCHKVPQKNLVRSYFRFKQFMIALPIRSTNSIY